MEEKIHPLRRPLAVVRLDPEALWALLLNFLRRLDTLTGRLYWAFVYVVLFLGNHWLCFPSVSQVLQNDLFCFRVTPGLIEMYNI